MTRPGQQRQRGRARWVWLTLALIGCDPAPGALGPAPGAARTVDAVVPGPEPGDDRRPNIVVIIADDVAIADLSTYVPGGVPMPHLDALAAEGVRMTAGYASASVCGPSRAGLFTGRYQQRFGFEYNLSNADQALIEGRGLPVSERTLGDALADEGYRTGLIGKWHLGYGPEHYPTNRGFEEFFGIRSGSAAYMDPDHPDAVFVPTPGVQAVPPRRWHEEVVQGPDAEVVHNEDEYLTDAFTDQALHFLDTSGDDPFVLVVSYTAAHTPLQTTWPYWDRFPDIQEPEVRAKAAMLAAMDDGIGRIVHRLDSLGISDETLVIFASDNGCALDSGSCQCTPYRGGKKLYYEAGIRVPFVVRLPDRAGAGTDYDAPTSLLDIFATAVAAAGGTPGDVDGVDLGPYLRGTRTDGPHPQLFWRAIPQLSMRAADEKMLRRRGSGWRVYDLATDPGESQDLWTPAWEPEPVAQDAFHHWFDRLAPAAWPGKWSSGEICGEHFDVML